MISTETSGEFSVLLRKHIISDELKKKVRAAIKRFRRNIHDERIGNHPLKGSMKGLWAFSVTDDFRIVYQWIGKNTVRLLVIGPHKTVYG